MDLQNFQVVGISFKKTDVSTRSAFSIAAERAAELYRRAPSEADFVVLSTCNRTEIYGKPTSKYFDFLEMLAGDFDVKNIEKFTYKKRGIDAVRHLFLVTSGLDSQILGDYEIVGQIKKSFAAAKLLGNPSGLTERIFNAALQVSKKIKNETRLSDGSLSVAHAAVSLLKKDIKAGGDSFSNKKIALIGLGNIGLLTLKNLLKVVDSQQVTLVNRTFDLAENVAAEFGCCVAEFSDLEKIVAASDVIFTAATAPRPFLTPQYFSSESVSHGVTLSHPVTCRKIVFDLAVPPNVAADVRHLPNVRFYDVDSISKLTDSTRANRHADLPKAIEIVDNQLVELENWLERRKQIGLFSY